MRKKRVYVESSVISYLTARPPKKAPLKLAHQNLTKVWWDRRSEWECFLTPLVQLEIGRGDPSAARLRMEKARLLMAKPTPPEAEALADLLLARKLVPVEAAPDAFHLAEAACYRADYLLTWNHKHLDNLDLRERIEELIRGWGLTPAKVITPERLLEGME